MHVPSDGALRSLKALLVSLEEGNVQVEGVAVHAPGLDDVFLALTERTTTHRETAR